MESIVDEERRREARQIPAALRVRAAEGHLPRHFSSTMQSKNIASSSLLALPVRRSERSGIQALIEPLSHLRRGFAVLRCCD